MVKKRCWRKVREGESVGIYLLKKEHTLEDFEKVKEMLENSKKRNQLTFAFKESFSIGDLEKIYFTKKMKLF